jgi:hypothetical protein
MVVVPDADEVRICDVNGKCTEKDEKKSGCERFDGICGAKAWVIIIVTISLLFCVAAGTFSEKTYLMIGLMTAATVGGFIAMVVWLRWSKAKADDLDVEKVSLGTGGWLITAGWISGLFAVISLSADSCCQDASERKGLEDDGITVVGRMSSAGTIFVPLLLFMAVTEPQWSVATDIRKEGGFLPEGSCMKHPDQPDEWKLEPNQQTICQSRQAKFGLWMYCVQEDVPMFPDGPVDVCVKWNTPIVVSGTESAQLYALTAAAGIGQESYKNSYAYDDVAPDDSSGQAAVSPAAAVALSGNDRFEDSKAKRMRKITALAVLGSAIFSMAADVYSEKHILGALLCIISACCGVAATIFWSTFQSNLSDLPSMDDIKTSNGASICIAAFCIAILSSIGYCSNALQHDRSNEDDDDDPEEAYGTDC